MASSPSTLSRLARFAVMGGVGFVLNIGITVGLHEGLGAPEELAFGVALVVVFVFSFVTSRYLIFEGTAGGDPKKQLVKFAVSNAGFRVAEYVGFLVFHTVLGIPYVIAIVAVLAVSFLTKFFTYSTVVFVNDRESSS